MPDDYTRDMRGGGTRPHHYHTKGANDPTHGEIEGEWSDAEDAWVYDKILGPGNRPERLQGPVEGSDLAPNEEEPGALEEGEKDEAAAAMPPPADLVDPWTTVSGKLRTSERDAFKSSCKIQDVVPSKMIRAFVRSFCNPEPEAAPVETLEIPYRCGCGEDLVIEALSTESQPVQRCKKCASVLEDDYYRFEGEYTCGGCVTKLITEREDTAYRAGMKWAADNIIEKTAQPPPGSPGEASGEEQPAQPPPEVAELERVQCGRCLGEAFVPEATITWTCAVCHFVNAAVG